MASSPGPQRLAQALSELIGYRGYARVQGNAQLQSAWTAVAGTAVARQTRAVAIKRGVLQVSVASAPLLSELAGFYRVAFIEKLKELHADLRIHDLKFRLDSDLAQPPPAPTRPDG
jgi:predicted nucleic acid-binding Zn ribbon protein